MEEEFQHKTYKALWLRRVRAAVSLAQILAQIRADICFPNQNHVMLAFERRECRAFVLGTLGMTFWMGRVDVQEMFPVYGKIPFESGEGKTWFYSQRFGVQIMVCSSVVGRSGSFAARRLWEGDPCANYARCTGPAGL